MTAVEELPCGYGAATSIQRAGAAILEKACADAVALAAQRFEAALEAMTHQAHLGAGRARPGTRLRRRARQD